MSSFKYIQSIFEIIGTENPIFSFKRLKGKYSKKTFHSKIKFRTQNNCVCLEANVVLKAGADEPKLDENGRENLFPFSESVVAGSLIKISPPGCELFYSLTSRLCQ